MVTNRSGSGGVGLERSCEHSVTSRDWIRQWEVGHGVELFEAWLPRLSYRPHRHDTYAISLTEAGVLEFGYRGATHLSLPGNVVVLHPDELHDGHPGSPVGFAYRQLYVEPAVIFAAIRSLYGQARSLPFVRSPVVANETLASAIRAAFLGINGDEHLAIDDLIVRVAEGLLAADPPSGRSGTPKSVDVLAIDSAREFLDAETTRVISSAELEEVTGIDRYNFARQFRTALGTSPYRYSRLRRLARARASLVRGQALAETAAETGFADQAHLTRLFTAAYGMTPGQYRTLALTRPKVAASFPTTGRWPARRRFG
jgi:AraC-like DNA-binding protein